MNCRGSKLFTSAPIRQANCDASKPVMRSTPLFPASSACHTSGTVLPTAQMVPIPVTTTRRCKLLCSFRVRVDVIHRVLYGADLLRIFVGNLDLKGFFESHDQFDCIERIRPKIVYEGRARRHFRIIHPQLLHYDLLNPFFSRSHRFLLSRRTFVAAGKPVSVIAEMKPCKPCPRLSGKQKTEARALVAVETNPFHPTRSRLQRSTREFEAHPPLIRADKN